MSNKSKKCHFTQSLLLSAAATTTVVGITGPAFAQNPHIEEIIVTAQRREQNLQDVPLSVSVFTGADLVERGVTDLPNVVTLVPGATFTGVNATEPVISIRGVSSGGEGAASDAGVLLLIDGEVITRDFMRSAPIFDVERVEVLRGPQGTTYGRNATGGVFHVLSRRPSDDYELSGSLDVGEYSYIQAQGAISGPISETDKLRLSGHFSKRDGYSENILTGDDIDFQESAALRFQWLHSFSEQANLLVRAHYSNEDSGLQAGKAPDPFSPTFGPFAEGVGDKYKVVYPPGEFKREIYGLSAEVNAVIGEVDVVSLTTWRDGSADIDVTAPFGLVNGPINHDAQIFSQELRLQGALAGGRGNWLTGLYFLQEDVDYFSNLSLLVGLPLETRLTNLQHSDTQSVGLFAEIGWSITDALRIIGGFRYSDDSKDFDIDSGADGAIAGALFDDPSQPVVVSTSESWTKPTGRASLEYDFNDDVMAYVTYSQGYKAGGFNSEVANVEAASTPFDEETVANVEGGLRSTLFERRLRLNATVFSMAYEDIQTASFAASGTGTKIISNIGEAEIRGFELEAAFRPHPLFSVSTAYANYDGEYKDFIDADGVDLDGTRMQNVPRWTWTLNGTAETPVIAGAGSLRLRADYRSRSEVFRDSPSQDSGRRPGSEITDLRLSWLPVEGRWEVSAWVRNVFDKAEVAYISGQGFLNQRMHTYGPPRTMGVSVSVSMK